MVAVWYNGKGTFFSRKDLVSCHGSKLSSPSPTNLNTGFWEDNNFSESPLPHPNLRNITLTKSDGDSFVAGFLTSTLLTFSLDSSLGAGGAALCLV